MRHVPHNVEFLHPQTWQWMVWDEFPSRKTAKENEPQISVTLSTLFKSKPLTSIVATHRSKAAKFDRRTLNAPPPRHQFSFFFDEHPKVLAELARLGIKFAACDVGGDVWPALLLPSGKVLAISEDPEGNGPGAIHVFDQE